MPEIFFCSCSVKQLLFYLTWIQPETFLSDENSVKYRCKFLVIEFDTVR